MPAGCCSLVVVVSIVQTPWVENRDRRACKYSKRGSCISNALKRVPVIRRAPTGIQRDVIATCARLAVKRHSPVIVPSFDRRLIKCARETRKFQFLNMFATLQCTSESLLQAQPAALRQIVASVPQSEEHMVGGKSNEPRPVCRPGASSQHGTRR